jgi:hypothetical protein
MECRSCAPISIARQIAERSRKRPGFQTGTKDRVWDKTASRHSLPERPIPPKPAFREAAKGALPLARLELFDERGSILNRQGDSHSSGDHCGHRRMIMETPETETIATKRQVWNAGSSVGAKRAQVEANMEYPRPSRQDRSFRRLCRRKIVEVAKGKATARLRRRRPAWARSRTSTPVHCLGVPANRGASIIAI